MLFCVEKYRKKQLKSLFIHSKNAPNEAIV